MKSISFLFALIFVASFWPQKPAAGEEQQLPPGQIIERVVAQKKSDQSYALYLPKSYTPEKKWPILYCFDAMERGKFVVELFQRAAEQYGYIVASSNNSRSDDPTAPNLQAIQAMWEDTHERFSIEDQRGYATGFSGGARVACDMAYLYNGKIAGVIGVGAGFPEDKPPVAETPFVFYGTIGNKDFNFHEMRLLEKELTRTGVPHWIEIFDGVHQWPPAEICTEAIEWMEIRAMKDQKKEVDAALLQSLFDKRFQKAEKLEADSKQYRAFVSYQQIVQDFQGLGNDLQKVEGKIKELEASEPVQKFAQEQEKRDAEDTEYRNRFIGILKAIRAPGDAPLSLNKLRAGLDLEALKQKAATLGGSEDGLAALRRLEAVFVQMVFYLPSGFMEREQYQRAAVCLSIAAEIKPNDPEVWFDLARAHSMNEDLTNSLEALTKALDKGFSNVERLQNDIDLKAVRGEKQFKEILKRAQKKNPSEF